MNTENRRKYPRLYKSFKIELKKLIFPVKQQKLIKTECLNISAGGLLLRVDEPFEIGDKVQVVIFVNIMKFHSSFFKIFESITDQKVSAIGEVVRVENRENIFDVGIKFLDIYEDDWKALYNFILKEYEKDINNDS